MSIDSLNLIIIAAKLPSQYITRAEPTRSLVQRRAASTFSASLVLMSLLFDHPTPILCSFSVKSLQEKDTLLCGKELWNTILSSTSLTHGRLCLSVSPSNPHGHNESRNFSCWAILDEEARQVAPRFPCSILNLISRQRSLLFHSSG